MLVAVYLSNLKIKIMSWNHRILAHENNGEVYFQLHEVYYTNEVPDGYTSNPITVGSETLKGIKWTLNKMQEAIKKPVLWAGEKFPNECIVKYTCDKRIKKRAMARILVACEESQAITKAFRKLGHEAFSCDLLPCSGGHPEWHFQQDVFEVIDKGWDLMIAHPPCTYLSVAGAWAMYNKDGSINEVRMKNQNDALDFVRKLMDAPIKHIAIENPISVISSQIRKPDQIVHPYHFGEKASKSTCLWLKNLPKLKHTNVVEKGEFKEWVDKKTGKTKRQATWIYDCLQQAKSPEHLRTLRSKTFQGIADAIAEQWGDFLNSFSDENV